MPSPPSEQEFYAYKRNLPHWRLKGGVYFISWRLHKLQTELHIKERELIVSVLIHFNRTRYNLHAYVVMNDHIHALVEPLAENKLEAILHSWKSYSANQLQRRFARKGAVWQKESFDRIIRDETEYIERTKYIHDNPFLRWLEITEYPWMGFPAWDVGKEGNKK